jgi:hypothetical protein
LTQITLKLLYKALRGSSKQWKHSINNKNNTLQQLRCIPATHLSKGYQLKASVSLLLEVNQRTETMKSKVLKGLDEGQRLCSAPEFNQPFQQVQST